MIRLSVSPKNENAINFYLHLGYSKIISSKIIRGMVLWKRNLKIS